MNIRQLRDLVIKAIGLMCVGNAALLLPQIAGLLDFFWEPQFNVGRAFLALAFVLAMLFYALLAYVLLFQTHAVAGMLWPEDEVITGPDFTTTLETCVALIGVYYLPSALSRITSDVMALAVIPGSVSWYQTWGQFIPHGVLAAVAVLLIVKSKAIAAYIRKCAE